LQSFSRSQFHAGSMHHTCLAATVQLAACCLHSWYKGAVDNTQTQRCMHPAATASKQSSQPLFQGRSGLCLSPCDMATELSGHVSGALSRSWHPAAVDTAQSCHQLSASASTHKPTSLPPFRRSQPRARSEFIILPPHLRSSRVRQAAGIAFAPAGGQECSPLATRRDTGLSRACGVLQLWTRCAGTCLLRRRQPQARAERIVFPHLRGRHVQQAVPARERVQVRAVASSHVARHRDASSQAGVQNLLAKTINL
jgi:hypothetical protein